MSYVLIKELTEEKSCSTYFRGLVQFLDPVREHYTNVNEKEKGKLLFPICQPSRR